MTILLRFNILAVCKTSANENVGIKKIGMRAFRDIITGAPAPVLLICSNNCKSE